MSLSSDLISQFVKVTNDKTEIKQETTVYGTAMEYNGSIYVKLDGSDLLTPVSTTTDMKAGERVAVLIKDHTATVTGNLSSPAARTDDVKDLDGKVSEIGNQITEFEIVIADKVSVQELDAVNGRIDELRSDNVTIKDTLTAQNGVISELQADNVTIKDTLTANAADIETLQTTKLDAAIADLTYATITDLEATDAKLYNLESTYGEFASLTTNKFEAIDATIRDLDTKYLSAENADLLYANIDFANIGEAAIQNFYSKSGIIQDLVISDGQVTGQLVGVTIKGDLIEGGTVVADKLVIQGEDGLYYKLNTNGETISANQTEYNSLNGTIITAKSITAEKVAVDDLVAFGATIGGFHITDSAIYSGVKESVDNTTRGIYLDNAGQISIGDAKDYVKYYRDIVKIEWDGDTTGITTVVGDFYKMSDIIPNDITDLIGQTIVVNECATDYSWTINETMILEIATNAYAISLSGSVEYITCIVVMDAVPYGDVTVSPGVYFICAGEGIARTYNSKLTFPSKDYKLKISASSIFMSSSNKSVEDVVGDAITKQEEEFYRSTSYIEPTGGAWSNISPTWTEGTYIWKRTLLTYGNGDTEYIPNENGVCITGNTGATGNGISKTEVYYYLSMSNTAQTGGSWSTTVPDWVDGRYYWQKIKTTYTNGNSAESTPVCITGAKGSTGSTGTGVDSITTEFYLSTSKTAQSGGSWVTTMPTWSSGKYLWTRNKIVYKNPTSTVYTTPVCDSSWEAVNEIQIGGRNYIKYGKGDRKEGFFTYFGSVENGYGELTLTSQKTYSNISLIPGFVLNCRDYEVGKQVVFSYDIMYTVWDFPEGSDRQEFWIGQRYGRQTISGGDTTGQWLGVTQHNLPVVGQNGCELNEWYHVERVLTIPNKAAEGIEQFANIQFYNSNADVSASVTLRIKNAKIEYGNKATDWTPAPEDIETVVSNVETRVTHAETSIENNQTEISLRATTETVTEISNQTNALDKAIEDAKLLIKENSDAIATLTSRDFKVEFTTIANRISALDGDLTAYKEEVGNWMRFDADGNLVLGATRVEGQDAYELKLTKNRISFMLNDSEVAYISSNQLYITNSTVVQNLKIGGFTWEVRGNGNLGLVYR